jgi:hypothetical protein
MMNKNIEKPIVRSSVGLRDFIFDELDALNSGKSNPQRTNAITKAAQSILDSATLELSVSKFLCASGKNSVPMSPIPLGNG